MSSKKTDTKVKSIEFFDDRFYRIEKDGQVDFYPSVTTVLSVTNKPWLNRWRADLGSREADLRMDVAAQEGTRIHHTCKSLMEGGYAIFNPQYRPAYTKEEIQELQIKYGDALHIIRDQFEWLRVIRFVEWVKIVKPIPIASEVMVYDKVNKCAGSFDYLFWIKGGSYQVSGRTPIEIQEGLSIWDLKSGKNVEDDAEIQASKYANMANLNIAKGVLKYSDSRIPNLDQKFVIGAGIIHVQASTRTGIEGVATKYLDATKVKDNTQYFDNHLLPVWRRRNQNMMPRVFDMPSALTLKEI